MDDLDRVSAIDGSRGSLESHEFNRPDLTGRNDVLGIQGLEPIHRGLAEPRLCKAPLISPNAHTLKEPFVEGDLVGSFVERGLGDDLQLQEGAGCKRSPSIEEERKRSLGASLSTSGRDYQNASVHVGESHWFEAPSCS